MKKYLLLYKSPMSAEDQMKNADPEQAKKVMDIWMAWFQKAGDAVIDGGAPTQKVATIGEESPANGFIGGYSIVQAENTEAVKKLLEGHPHMMMDGASIKVLEILPMPGM